MVRPSASAARATLSLYSGDALIIMNDRFRFESATPLSWGKSATVSIPLLLIAGILRLLPIRAQAIQFRLFVHCKLFAMRVGIGAQR